MNPVFAHRVHVGAITALIVVVIVTIGRRYSSTLPPGYGSIIWFGMIYSGIVIALLVERLRQVIAKSVTVDPRAGIETLAVYTGQVLIFLAVPGYIVAFTFVAPDGEIQLGVRPGTQNGQILRIAGRGLPVEEDHRGDLLAHVEIVIPESPTPRERALFERLASESRFRPRA